MYCQNCGAANEDGAKFCANCGTTLGDASTPAASAEPPVSATTPYQAPAYQAPPYQPSAYQAGPPTGGNSMAKNIGIGCLIAFAIFLFVGLSCTRACFGLRRTHILRRY